MQQREADKMAASALSFAYAQEKHRDAFWSELLAVLLEMLAHTQELEDAWCRGAISEHDSLGGARSNRNVECVRKAQAVLADIKHLFGGADAEKIETALRIMGSTPSKKAGFPSRAIRQKSIAKGKYETPVQRSPDNL